jgi:hypothetical protein
MSFQLLQTTSKTLSRPPRIASALLDTIASDLKYALDVEHTETSLTVTTADDHYRYAVLNKRLARIRDGLLYLSPVTPSITTFSVTTTDARTYQLTLTTAHESETRLARRRN